MERDLSTRAKLKKASLPADSTVHRPFTVENGGKNKKQLIIDASQKLIAEKGLKNCSIAEIAKRAGVVDSILYHYFVNKDDLLFATLEEQLKKAKVELESHLSGIVEPMSKLGKVIWYHLSMNDYDSGFARTTKHLLLECRSKQQFYQHDSFSVLREYAKKLEFILEEGIEKGVFSPDINASLVTEMIFGLLDEESLSYIASQEVDATTPDFEPIMLMISSMIGRDRSNKVVGKRLGKRSVILKAAKQLFAEKGYDKATIIEIANRANVAEGTIYEYFKNKKDLFFSIPTEQFASYKDSMREFLVAQKPMINLRRLIYLHFMHLTSDREFLMLYLHDIIRDREFYSTNAYERYLDYTANLHPILDEGKDQGVFEPGIDNRVFRNLFLGTFTHLAIRWFVLDRRTPLQMMDEFNHVATLLCRAVVSEKGRSEPLGFVAPF
jgi:AcrR family transcriptional regulator